MKKTLFAASLACFLIHSPATGAIGYPQKDPSMARVLRLFEAEFGLLRAGDPMLEQYQEDRRTVGYQDFPAYKRFLEDKDFPPYNNWSYHILISYVSKIDGSNMQSTGDVDMLRLTREFLTVKSGNPDWQSAAYSLLYLSQKGLSDDLPLLEKYSTLPSKLDFAKQAAMASLRVLQARASGTNILTFLQTRYYCWSTNEPPFLPSVANTGPQAAYVYDLLKQALAKYGSATNIPQELVTMRVSFDANGKPVCSADLAKYGLVMPDFPSPKSPFPARTEHAAAVPAPTAVPSATVTNRPATQAPRHSVSPSHVRLGVGAGLVCMLFALGYFIHRGKRE